jgi:hypothetical protein
MGVTHDLAVRLTHARFDHRVHETGERAFLCRRIDRSRFARGLGARLATANAGNSVCNSNHDLSPSLKNRVGQQCPGLIDLLQRNMVRFDVANHSQKRIEARQSGME